MIGPSDAFVWGSGGAQLTPTQIDAQRKVAQALMAQGTDSSPVQSWTQGASRVAQAIFGGMQARDANDTAKANMTAEAKVLASLPSLISGQPSASGVGSTPSISRPMGRLSIPTPSDKIYSNDEPSPLDPPSGADRDAAIRTVLAEAADQGPVGMNAVASVIRNRAVNGGYGGDTPTGVVTAPNQFEPWNTAAGRGRMAAIDPNGSQYAAAGRALDQAYAGNDPTNGATMFYGPGTQAALGRRPPAWDNGTGVDIGGHRFFGGAPQTTRVAMADPTATTDGPPMAFAGQPATAAPEAPQRVAQAAPVDTGGGSAPSTPGFVAAPTISPGLLRASTDQRFSEGTRKILGAIAIHQMETALKQSDPAYQVDLQLKRGQLQAQPLDMQSKALAVEELRNKLTHLGAPTVDAQGNLVQKDAVGKVNMLRPAPNAPSDVAEYNFYADQETKAGREPKPFEVWDLSRRRSTATTVNNNLAKDEGAFEKKGAELQAGRFNDLVDDGQKSRQMAADITTLVDLGKSIGTGKGAQFKASIGPYAESLGIKVDGLSDIQAFEAIVNRVAPNMRVKGSGSQSDYELRNFLKSLPSLGNTPEGNEIAAAVMQGLTQNKVLAADIASKALNKEISRSDAEKQLRELPDPMQQYRDYKASRSKVDNLLQKYGPR